MSLELCICRCARCVVRGHHNVHTCANDKSPYLLKDVEKKYRYKILITGFKNGPWSSTIERPVTVISWDLKSQKQFWLSKLGYAKTDKDVPLLFSKAAADAIMLQIDRWNFAGPGQDGKATVRTVPVEVK